MDNTIALLTGINANVRSILNVIQMSNNASVDDKNARTISDLTSSGSKANVNLGDANRSDSGKVDANVLRGKETSIAELVGFLGSLPDAVKNVAKIKQSDIEKFTNIVDAIISTMDKIVKKYADGNPEMVKSMAELFKSTADLSKFIDSVSKIGLKVIPAKLGIKLIGGIFDDFLKLILKIGNMDGVEKANANIKLMGGLVKNIVKIVGMMALTVGIMAIVGVLVIAALPQIAIGFVGMVGVLTMMMFTMMLISKIASKIEKFTFDVRNVILMYMMSALIIGVAALMGVLIKAAWEPICYGLVGMTAVLLGLTFVYSFISMIAKGKELSMMNVAAVVAMYMASALIIAMAYLIGELVVKQWGKILLGFGTMTAVLWGIYKISNIINKIGNSKSVRTAAINALIIEGVMIASSLVILAAVGTSLIIKKAYSSTKEAIAGIGGTFALMSLIVGSCAALSKLVSNNTASIAKGATGLLLMEGVLLAANVVILAMVYTSKIAEGKWDSIWATFGSMTAMLTAIGLLAAGAGYLAPFIMPGVGALALVELLIGGMMLVTVGLIKLHQYKEESGVGWDDMFLDITAMAGIMGEVGVLAALMAPLAIPVTIGLVSVALVAGYVKKLERIVMATSHIRNVIEKHGGVDNLTKTITNDLPKILKAFKSDNLSFGFKDTGEILLLSAMMGPVARLAKKFLTTAEALAKLATIGGMMDDKGNIRPIIGKNDDGTPKYGDPVDLKLLAGNIGGAIKDFVVACSLNFEDAVKILNSVGVYEKIDKIIDPVTKFVKMITSVTSSGEGTLTPMYVDKDGKLVSSGIVCNVTEVSKSIADAVGTFVETLFDEKYLTKWIEITQGKKDGSFIESVRVAFGGDTNAAKAIEKMGGILGTILSPVADFVELLSGYSAVKGGKLRTVSMSSDGKVIYGPEIDVATISSTIVGCITTFVNALYDDKNVNAWVTKGEKMNTAKIINPIKAFIDQVKQFSDTKVLDPKKIDAVNNSISNVLSSMNKSIIDMDDAKIVKVAVSLSGLSKSITKFDTTLQKDADKRKKRLEELKKVFSDLSNSLKSTSNDLNAFTSAMNTISDMDTKQIKENLGAVATGIKSVGKASEGLESTSANKASGNILQQAMYDAMAQALRDVFTGAQLKKPLEASNPYTMSVS